MMLPATTNQTRWLVGPDGVTEKRVISKRLSRHETHRAMRLGLAHVLEFLTKAGFRCNCISQSDSSISLRFKNFDFDISIRAPGRIAYVTSRPGASNDKNQKLLGRDLEGNPVYEPQSTVKFASDELKGHYVVQIIAASVSSLNPVYVDFGENVDDPIKHMIRQVLGVVASIMADQGLMNKMNQDTSGVLKEITGQALTLLEDHD